MGKSSLDDISGLRAWRGEVVVNHDAVRCEENGDLGPLEYSLWCDGGHHIVVPQHVCAAENPDVLMQDPQLISALLVVGV